MLTIEIEYSRYIKKPYPKNVLPTDPTKKYELSFTTINLKLLT